MQNDSGQPAGLTEASVDPARRVQLRKLLGRAPDPIASRELLGALTEPGNPDARWLASTMCLDENLCDRPLRELLPGLGLVESSRFSVRLSVRAANALIRAEAATLTSLAGMSVGELSSLPSLGKATVAETLLVVLDEWAASYLASVKRDPVERTVTVVDQVPPGAAPASDQVKVSDLADAFAEIESVPAFLAFRRRWLDPDRPSQALVATELGVSASRISRQESKVRDLLSRILKDGDSPISSAVASIQERLGSVARRKELEDALGSLDPAGAVISDDVSHRSALLLQLLDYNISGEWAVGPDMDLLTTAVLNASTEDGPAELDLVGRHLGRLGVREPLRLPWIVSQPGFEISEGRVSRPN